MPIRRPVLLLGLVVASLYGSANACKPTLTFVVSFDEGSATLRRDQIVLLANRLNEIRRLYPRFSETEVEGMASASVSRAKDLAQRRASATARAVTTLLGESVKVQTWASVFPPELNNGSNLASVQVLPPLQDIPDCTPVPIPGFKR